MKFSKTRRNILFLAIAMIAFATIIVMQYKSTGEQIPASTLSIELRADGYYPKEITINKGDTVVFSTTRNGWHWPASNLHPTHKIYGEFDPKEPVDADKTWSFKFDKVGVWNYHDHLAPLYRGTITVQEPSKTKVLGFETDCVAESADKYRCWENEIQTALNTGGMEKAFKIFSSLYAEEPEFAKDCHDYVHKLGEAAYEIIAKNKKFKLIPETDYCAYGFYHGLMEKILITDGGAMKAGKFCDDNEADITRILYDACYHGIGHGAMAFSVNDPTLWDTPQKLIDKSLDLCRETSNNTEETLWRCASGVFMELSKYYVEGQYGMTFDKENPFGICDKQEKSVALPCYTQMNGLIGWLAKNNLDDELKYVEKISKIEYRIETAQIISAANMNIEAKNYAPYVNSCRRSSSEIRGYCIRGLGLAFMLRGEPGKEYIKAIQFCKSDILTEPESSECMDSVMLQAKSVYTRDKIAIVCAELGNEAHNMPKYCNI